MKKEMKLLKTSYLLGSFALLIGFSAPLAYALPANEIETYYYTDANYTNEVGYTFLSCQGNSYREGRTARYRLRYQTPCSTGGAARVACYVDGMRTTCPANICDSPLFICQ